MLYARDGQLPPCADDEVTSTATAKTSTTGQATGVRFQSALPLGPSGATKAVTVPATKGQAGLELTGGRTMGALGTVAVTARSAPPRSRPHTRLWTATNGRAAWRC